MLAMSENKPINVAVIGCGYWGKNLVKAFATLGVLGAVSDAHDATAESFAKDYNVPAKTWDQILDDATIQAVALATPAVQHTDMAIQALQHGKHVFVEKPLAMMVADACRVIDVACQCNRQVMVGHILNYHPAFMALKQLVSDGRLGKLHHIHSSRLSLGKVRSEENIIWSFAPHDVSMVLALAGREPTEVTTHHSAFLNPEIADIGHMDLQFDQGLTAHIHVSWISPFKEQKLTVIGDKGMAVFEDSIPHPNKLIFYPHVVDTTTSPATVEKKDGIVIDVDATIEPLVNECRHFVMAAMTNMPALTDAQEGLRVLKILAQTDKG
jgi:UDP-2-acetamido-3-amino-2,3-dideoxy-glucuronate N-acetyltransferase